jgi:phospholipid transport system transporter-binding protein
VPRREGDRLLLEGDVTVGSVAGILAATAREDLAAAAIVDFRGVTEVDSAAVALAVAWLREARAAGRTLRFEHLPPAMTELARLYGVADFIPGAGAA